MKVAVLGTGMVGRALATKLVELGHDVRMGSRSTMSESAIAWVEEAAGLAGGAAGEGTFFDAAQSGELVVNATAGASSIEALEAAGEQNLAGKVLVDVANPIAPGSGMPPALAFCNTESLGERIQERFPDARVVKTLNTVNAAVMVDPGSVPGPHNVFLGGDDEGAKTTARGLLEDFGWPAGDIIDLGDITSARGTEMYLALWLRLYGAVDSPTFNVEVKRGAK
jgi:hypothetical protein